MNHLNNNNSINYSFSSDKNSNSSINNRKNNNSSSSSSSNAKSGQTINLRVEERLTAKTFFTFFSHATAMTTTFISIFLPPLCFVWYSQQPTEEASLPVWSDLAKFCHFGETFNVLAILCRFIQNYSAKLCYLLWQILYAIGQTFIHKNGHSSKK